MAKGGCARRGRSPLVRRNPTNSERSDPARRAANRTEARPRTEKQAARGAKRSAEAARAQQERRMRPAIPKARQGTPGSRAGAKTHRRACRSGAQVFAKDRLLRKRSGRCRGAEGARARAAPGPGASIRKSPFFCELLAPGGRRARNGGFEGGSQYPP